MQSWVNFNTFSPTFRFYRFTYAVRWVRGDQVVLLKQILLPRERTHYSCSITHGIPFYKRTSGKIRLHGQNLKEEKGVK